MTKDSMTLDIAQRIAAAMTATGEPHPNKGEGADVDDQSLGEVPKHLRHLFNLGSEAEDEVKAAHTALMMAKKRHELVMETFSLALQSAAPFDVEREGHIGLKICKNWQVVGLTRDEASADMHGMDLKEMFGEMFKHKSSRHSH